MKEAERLDLELERGRVLKLAGDERADELLRTFAAAAEARGDGERMAEAVLAMVLDWADLIEEDAEMVALLRQALALLPSGDSAIRARLEGHLAQEAFLSVPDGERRAMVGRALAMARRVGDAKALASVLTAHSWIVAGPESLPERLALAEELVAVGREAGLPYAECDGHHMRFLALVELGDVEAADDTLAAARSAARTGRARGTVAFLEAARALLAGRLEDAEVEGLRAYEIQSAAGTRPPPFAKIPARQVAVLDPPGPGTLERARGRPQRDGGGRDQAPGHVLRGGSGPTRPGSGTTATQPARPSSARSTRACSTCRTAPPGRSP